MAELKLLPLDELLNEGQVDVLMGELSEVGVDDLPDGESDFGIDEVIDDDQLLDFMDRLDVHDLACTIFLPVEFDGTLTIGDHTIGSSFALLDGLEELREELAIDDEHVDIEDDEIDIEVLEEHLRFAWRVFTQAANNAIDRLMPLHVVT